MIEQEQLTKWFSNIPPDTQGRVASMLKDRRSEGIVPENVLGVKGEEIYKVAVVQSLLLSLMEIKSPDRIPKWVLSQLAQPIVLWCMESDEGSNDGYDLEIMFGRHHSTPRTIYASVRDSAVECANEILVHQKFSPILTYARQQIPAGLWSFIEGMNDFI